ncbi:MAG: succinylglutamate desuccinylase/aspartoacylase family protein [Acidiferrobacterales bacterium]
MTPQIKKPSRVTTDVDLDADGKHFGFLNVPCSRNESAWGTVRIPIISIKRGNGATVLFTGGNHGDEYEGPIALLNLARSLEPKVLSGQVMIIPALNLPAVRAGTRLSPIDSLNMNRAFPGDRTGSVTEMIAHYVYTEILPRVNAVVDIHAGGKTLSFVPSVVVHQLADQSLMEQTIAALKAFDAPLGLVLRELDNEGMLDTAVEEMGKIFLSTELGGGGTVTTQTVAIADNGIQNVLRHFGLLQAAVPAGSVTTTRLMHTPDDGCYVMADDSGIYEVLVDLGAEVAAGTAVGQIHFYQTPQRPPLVQCASRPGTVVCRHFPGLVQVGDCLAVLATDYSLA